VDVVLGAAVLMADFWVVFCALIVSSCAAQFAWQIVSAEARGGSKAGASS
jgi:hypothetical protein